VSNEPLSALDLGDGFKKGALGREVAFVLGLHAPVPLTYLVPTFAAVAAHHFPPLSFETSILVAATLKSAYRQISMFRTDQPPAGEQPQTCTMNQI